MRAYFFHIIGLAIFFARIVFLVVKKVFAVTHKSISSAGACNTYPTHYRGASNNPVTLYQASFPLIYQSSNSINLLGRDFYEGEFFLRFRFLRIFFCSPSFFHNGRGKFVFDKHCIKKNLRPLSFFR